MAAHLSRLVADGVLRPGDKLPGETRLAAHLGISRPVLRIAIAQLVERGVLSVVPRSGTFVSGRTQKQGLDDITKLVDIGRESIRDIVEIRRLLDPTVAALAALRWEPEDMAVLDELVATANQLQGPAILQRPEGGLAYARFFGVLARSTHNQVLVLMIDSLSRLARDALLYSRAHLAQRTGLGQTFLDQMAAIYVAVRARDAAGARQAAERHLDTLELELLGAIGMLPGSK